MTITKIITAATLCATVVACQSTPKADAATTADAKTAIAQTGEPYKIDAAQYVNFIGTKPVGQHNGRFTITDGTLSVMNDASLTGGRFTIDITSLAITDADTSGAGKLKGHLSSPDFFDAAKFPTATFEITNVQPFVQDSSKAAIILDGATHTISGNLALKGVTKNVTFPAKIFINKDELTAKANFNINRTDWGLVYGSDKSLGDKFIRPEVNISFDIKAHKAAR